MIDLRQSMGSDPWDRARIELGTPGSATRHISAAKQVTDCAMRPCALSLQGRRNRRGTGGGGAGGGGGARGEGEGGGGAVPPPNNLHKYALLFITKVCHFKKNYVCPPICKKIYVCPPICNCFLRACIVSFNLISLKHDFVHMKTYLFDAILTLSFVCLFKWSPYLNNFSVMSG